MRGKQKEQQTVNFALLFTQTRKYQKSRNYAKAQECYLRLLALTRKEVQLNRMDKAMEGYRMLLSLDSSDAIVRTDIGNLLMAQQDFLKAAEYYRKAAEIQPDYTDAWYNLGCALQNMGKEADALHIYTKVIALKSDFSMAYFNMGNIYRHLGDKEAARASYEKAAALGYAEAYFNLAKLHDDSGNKAEAVKLYEKAAETSNDAAEVYYNKAEVAKTAGHFDEAITYYQHALAVKPDYADCYNNIGHILQATGRLDEAEKYYEQAIAVQPETAYVFAYWNKALLLLQQGDYERGFAEYEWRFKTGRTTDLTLLYTTLPRWQGEQLNGKKLLVLAEQGFGDSIQFIRYLRLVKEAGGTVGFVTRPELACLFAELDIIDELFIYVSDEEAARRYDYVIPLLSLPHLFKTTWNTVPSAIPYLSVDEKRYTIWQNKLKDYNKGLKVGLVWSGNSEDKERLDRTCGLAAYKPLADVNNVTFFSLQKEKAAQEVKKAPSGMQIVDLSPELYDFMDTAAVISQLDLVITVDTAVAHLAGALGKPVWVILPYNADWRWRLELSDTVWYPSMRLFRQKVRSRWEEVMVEAREALRELAAFVGAD